MASFSLYDAPGKNGFRYTPAKDTDSLVTAYLMRFFPQQQKKNILQFDLNTPGLQQYMAIAEQAYSPIRQTKKFWVLNPAYVIITHTSNFRLRT